MSASSIRSQLERKVKAGADAEKKVGEFRTREAAKRMKATSERAAAARASSPTSVKSRLSAAARYEDEANKAAKEAGTWSTTAAKCSREAADLQVKLAKAEQSERDAVEKIRKREQERAERRAVAERWSFESRLSVTENQVRTALKDLRAPKPEPLRVLLLGASSEGDLRVGREQERILAAVRSATHRDLVELQVHPAATADVLLDGLTQFQPHVVHFSGHSSADLIEFEHDADGHHKGAIVTARAFARAIGATDEPPLLVLLNSCESAPQAEKLVGTVPFAIGMSDTIGDIDAMT
ncbi:hypothetical protein [Actinacidiphila alni]|uniref:hypothetical protein n=1 Tax=Actinacidiphila alni TaxID=380248 RepID=UPI00345410EC